MKQSDVNDLSRVAQGFYFFGRQPATPALAAQVQV
jgi:hypothetical protein